MKDSQDWLDEIIKEILLVDNAALYELRGSGAIAVEDLKRVKNKYIKRCKQAIRKHILQEALGILEGVDIERPGGVKILDRSYYEMKAMLDDFLVMLRNKFNNIYKED